MSSRRRRHHHHCHRWMSVIFWRRCGHHFFLISIIALVLLESRWTPPLNGLECRILKAIAGKYGVTGEHSKRRAWLFSEELPASIPRSVHDCSVIRRDAWTPSSDEQWLRQCRPSLLWSLVMTGLADVSFHPSLLTSQATDVKAACRHYDTWSLLRRAKLSMLL
jgi:hypothetical protein